MSGRDDYLWDGAGDGDAELVALERLLSPLRHSGRPLPQLPPQPAPRRWPYWLAAAAALLAAMLWWWGGEDAGSTLRPGSAPRLLAAGSQPRRLELAGVGSLELQPGAVLELQDFSSQRARFHLRQGRIEARILPAPQVAPRFFQVGTPAADCIDLGCRYQLEVQEGGRAHVWVSEGQVVFQFGEREVYVPAGAECYADPGRGPFTPFFADARPELRKSLERFDRVADAAAEQRLEAAKELLGSCRDERDTLPAWHLLSDREPQVRAMAESRLLDLAGEPSLATGKDPHWDREEWKAFLRLSCWSLAK